MFFIIKGKGKGKGIGIKIINRGEKDEQKVK